MTGFVTNQFKVLTLTCGYDGDFNLPSVLSNCRAAATCPPSPVPPASTQLAPPSGGGTLMEFDIQVRKISSLTKNVMKSCLFCYRPTIV